MVENPMPDFLKYLPDKAGAFFQTGILQTGPSGTCIMTELGRREGIHHSLFINQNFVGLLLNGKMISEKPVNDQLVKLEDDKYYISADSTYADDRVKVLNHIDTFGIFDRWGDILPIGQGAQGIYHKDTRFLNRLEFKINGLRPLLLSSAIKEENEILSVDLTNPEMKDKRGAPVVKGMIHIRRSQFIRNSHFYEQILVTNHHKEEYEVDLSLRMEGDFKDIFEVRGLEREKRGDVFPPTLNQQKRLIIAYEGLDDIKRYARVKFSRTVEEISEENTIVFPLKLKPKESIALDYSVSFNIGDDEITNKDYWRALEQLEPQMEEAKELFPLISTSNEQFNHWINRSKADLLSLTARTPYGRYPYAGVPWYNTAFGRDGIITALETLWLAPELARDVLLFLSANQARELSPEQDAEPGKILHETRGGEMVELGELPFKQYYGTIDATPLYIMLAGAYFERTADLGLIKSIWPNIVAAIDWINEYGDLDGDGFVEYQHKAENGLTNQGWKDSFDSVSHANGNLAEAPIALCEVQGYVYAAKLHGAVMAKALGEADLAGILQQEAAALKQNFNQSFWDDELGCYALALDRHKNRCRVKSSNAGHALYTGIADADKAGILVKTLMGKDMFSGWGIRTLSEQERMYNPMSYHNGSIWPHDVAIVASGFSRYGYQKEVVQLLQGLFDASLFIDLQRLPELFCGFERRRGEGPTAYPVACSPQAWSVGAVFLMLQAILQFRVIAGEKRIYFNKPILPEFLKNVEINELQLGDDVCSIRINRYGSDEAVGVNIKNKPADWEMIVAS